MKKTMRKTIAFIMLLFIIGTVPASAYSLGLSPDAKVSRQQLEAQVTFFQDALNAFSAQSPDEAVALWAKGDQTRNGVYKYAVSCEALKQQLLREWGPPEKSFWIIGSSSPWMTGYEIVSKTELSDSEIRYVVQYEWASSAGPASPTREELILEQTPKGCCVQSFAPLQVVQFLSSR